MRIIKFTLIFLMLFLTISVYTQDKKTKIDSLLNRIIDTNELLGKRTQFIGEYSEQYLRFDELKKYMSDKDFLELLHHKNSVVKGYASWGLIDKKYPKLSNVFQFLLQSKDSAMIQSGCIIYEDDLATQFYNRLKYPEYDNELNKKDSVYYQHQLYVLDSVLLYSNEKHPLLYSALENNKRNQKNYNVIRKLALDNDEFYALIELAKYNKDSDVNSIMEKKENSFKAISFFPHPKFWNFLMSYETKQNNLEYYSAIVAYKNKDAILSLNRIYKALNKDDVKSVINLIEAISRNNYEGYQDLSLKIFNDYSITLNPQDFLKFTKSA